MEWLHELFKKSPEMALFLSLAVGYWIGKIKFGKFQLGGVAGSLLVAVLVSQVGVQVDNGVKAVLFALFIYAVGFESGPQFFSSLGKQSVKEIILAAVMAATGLATVIVMARLCGLDKGLAAGEKTVLDGQYRLTPGARVVEKAAVVPVASAGVKS